jgi:hypothetical protein
VATIWAFDPAGIFALFAPPAAVQLVVYAGWPSMVIENVIEPTPNPGAAA